VKIIYPVFKIENLTCAIICAASTTFYELNVAGISKKTGLPRTYRTLNEVVGGRR